MRWIKYALLTLGGLAVLGLVLIGIALVTLDNDDYRRLVIRGATFYTGYTVTIDGPFELELSAVPSLSAETIRIYPGANETPPPVSEIGKFKIRIGFWNLLRGILVVKELLTEDVVMAVIIDRDTDPGNLRSALRHLPADIDIPIVESVHLRNIHLDLIEKTTNHTVAVRLQQFELNDIRDTGPLFVNGQGSINDNEFKLDGKLGALSAIFKGSQPYPVYLNLSSTGFDLAASGTIEDLLDGEGVKIRLTGEAGELSHLFQLLQMEVPRLGHLKLVASIIHDFTAPGLADLQFSLKGESGIEFAVDGSAENILTGEGINIKFSGSLANPEIIKFLLPEGLPKIKQIQVAGEVRDTDGRLGIEHLNVNGTAEQGLALKASGRLDLNTFFRLPVITNTAIDIDLSLPTTELLKSYTTDALPELGPVTAQALVTGPLQGLSLENIVVRAGKPGALRMGMRGRVGSVPLSVDKPVADVKLTASVSAKTSSALSNLLGTTIPDLGPLNASGQITDRKGIYRMQDLNVAVGNPKKPAVKIVGAIEQLAKGYEPAVDGIKLQAAIRDLNLKPLSDLLGQPLPDPGPLNGSFQIAGNLVGLSVSKVNLSTASPQGMTMTVSGDIKRIAPQRQKPYKGIALTLSGKAPQLGALPGLESLELPDLGPLQIKANISDGGGSLNVNDFEIRTTKGPKASLRILGDILHLDDFRQMRLQAKLETDSQPWVARYLHRSPEKNYPLAGSVTVTGAKDGLHIKELRFGTANEKHLALIFQGDLGNLLASPEMDLRLDVSAPEPSELGPMLDLSLPPIGSLTINGRINGNLQKIVFDGRTRIGESNLTTKVNAALDAGPPRIEARVAAAVVNLADIGIFPQTAPETPVAAAQPQSQTTHRLFDDATLPLDFLKAVDLYLELNADQLVARNIAINDVNMGLRLEGGRLRIHPADLSYAEGSSSFEVIVDATGATPDYVLKITGEDIDIDDVLAHAHRPLILSGALNIVADLRSDGRSVRDIAANLSGELSLALEGGRIRRLVDFLSADALDLVFATTVRRKYTDLRCLVNKMQFEKGVGTIEVFYMDMPQTRVGGAGHINLADESIDVVLRPVKKKRLFRRGSAVQIKGPLVKPGIRTLPGKTAATIYGNIIMPGISLGSRVLGKIVYLLKRDRDAADCVFK
jgi:uncharacterized protein involved in outer membrane biogenesis